MSRIRPKIDARASSLSLCHMLCLCATWIRPANALPQAGSGDYVPSFQAGGDIALIPSAKPSSFTPQQSQGSPEGLIPSAPPASFLIPSQAQDSRTALIPTATTKPVAPSSALPLIPSFAPIGSAPITSNAITASPIITYGPSPMSTSEALKPIPPNPSITTGSPDGHHEIPAPNWSGTKICNGCVEVTASGWFDNPPEEQHTTAEPIQATISAGPSNILISQAPSDNKFVIGGSQTVGAGQTVTINDTPLAVQTTGGRVEVIVGTEVIALLPSDHKTTAWTQTTRAPQPLPPVLTIGTDTIIANQQTQYVVSGQTLSPGGKAITVSGSTISLAPSATAVVVNGATSSLVPNFGYVYTTAAPALTFKDQVYTVNRAGYITISPGTVLKPGGSPVTVDGTVLSLDNSGTAVVIGGSTSVMQPVSTVVTLTKSVGPGGNSNAGHTSGGNWISPTGKSGPNAKPVSAASGLSPVMGLSDQSLCGVILLLWWAIGCLAVGL